MTKLRARRAASAPVAVRHLHPGDVAAGTRGDRFETLLGSCVAIILTDPRRTVGAMCHIVHAGPASDGPREDTTHAGPAMASMFARLRALGIEPRLCEAYVYGGGNMFPTLAKGPQVGDRNAGWALGALADAGVRVLAQDLGGHGYRRLGWTVGPDAPEVSTVDVRGVDRPTIQRGRGPT
ncbi:MAG: chemotaxis protein CheD [Ideonella sp.]|nr:chemotaxis protein CheD [Ideonella sp.]